ncbi:MAG: hypothetical protein JO257_37085 [Deltaproteobacteria bacterium]|nr:hypothetical protein [Deltaproteobacteria bacterium]
MALAVLASSPAAADPDPDPNLDPYPSTYVDRPLLYASGMTGVELSVDAPTYRIGESSSTRLGDHVFPGGSVLHAFDGFQLGAGFGDTPGGPYVSGGGRFYAGPGAVSIDASMLLPNNTTNLDSSLVESLGYSLKAVPVPHVLAVGCSASVAAYEVSPMYAPSSFPVFAAGAAGGTLQLLPELAFGATIGASTPLAERDSNHSAVFASASMTYVYKMVDVFGFVRANELQHAPLPVVGGGVVLRFGR